MTGVIAVTVFTVSVESDGLTENRRYDFLADYPGGTPSWWIPGELTRSATQVIAK